MGWTASSLIMGIYVYPTDGDWFRFLRARSPLDEVNFWQPGGSTVFNRLRPGDLFLFRLKSPVNMIAGGGVFEHASLYPLNAAWEAFGEKNGVATYSELFHAIDKFRRKGGGATLVDDSSIGCIILVSPFFLPESEWIPVPADYHANLVQGKSFDLQSDTGQHLFEWASAKLRADAVRDIPSIGRPAEDDLGPVYGDPAFVKRRLGQGAFRVLISDVYGRRCAVTGEKTLPVLQAAHIQPVSRGGQHQISNGLLLRSDLHTLFDLGYVTVTQAGHFRVSPKLKETWMNGRVYYELDGAEMRMPAYADQRPSPQLLEWHNDVVFRS